MDTSNPLWDAKITMLTPAAIAMLRRIAEGPVPRYEVHYLMRARLRVEDLVRERSHAGIDRIEISAAGKKRIAAIDAGTAPENMPRRLRRSHSKIVEAAVQERQTNPEMLNAAIDAREARKGKLYRHDRRRK